MQLLPAPRSCLLERGSSSAPSRVASVSHACAAIAIRRPSGSNPSPSCVRWKTDPTGLRLRIAFIPRRNRTRIKARVLACIRRRGFQEEIVVCEDLSKGGVSFRSRNQYEEGSRLEMAVPFTPGSGAIFVPIRNRLFPRPSLPGLHRHGAAYIKPPLRHLSRTAQRPRNFSIFPSSASISSRYFLVFSMSCA